ncbi:MAG: hypothetical protein A4E57_00165 [Syntrophorhabdaceae bacterium PtaU1.Bin034]|nr:MAG: hypothetical protein A4E57_00165 [Syntrophorhabdaceae bacterium PtaU1.Bin034]
MKSKQLTFSIVLSLIAATAVFAFAAKYVPRMTKEQLLPLLGDPGVAVLDVRGTGDYRDSKAKIKGAVRIDMTVPVETWMVNFAKDKTLVLYCS